MIDEIDDDPQIEAKFDVDEGIATIKLSIVGDDAESITTQISLISSNETADNFLALIQQYPAMMMHVFQQRAQQMAGQDPKTLYVPGS